MNIEKTRRSSLDVLSRDLGGRPLRIDSTAARKFVSLLAAGGFVTPSARACGLPHQTVIRWRKRGQALIRGGVLPVWAGERLPAHRRGLDRLCRVLACIAQPLQDPELWLAAFEMACSEAEGQSESTLVAIWRKAVAERPELAVKMLEKRYPERWGQKPALKVEAGAQAGPGGAAAGVALTIYAPEEEEP